MSPPPAGLVRELWLLDDARIMGGGQRFALRLLRHLADRPDWRLRLVCPRDSRLAAEADMPVEDLRFPDPRPARALGLVLAAARLRRLLRQADARRAVVVGNSARSQACAMLATRGLRPRPPLVNLMHEQDSARRPLARWAHRRYGALAVVGANAADAYAAQLPGSPVHGLRNFLLPEELAALVAMRRERRSAARPAVLGVLARLIPEKGVLELVEQLVAAGQRWEQLRVAGEAQDRGYAQAVGERARQLGLGERVRLLGHVDDVPAFLAQLDALVVPSVGHEGQPTVILEGLAAGTPVLVRRALASADYAGLPVAAYEDAAELASALERVGDAPAPPDELARRFGPEQALAAIEAAARQGGG